MSSKEHYEFPLSPEDIKEVFVALDGDNSNDIDREEMKQLFKIAHIPPPPAHEMEAFFNRVDTDGDGKISFSEFEFFVTHRQQLLLELFLDICDRQTCAEERAELERLRRLHQIAESKIAPAQNNTEVAINAYERAKHYAQAASVPRGHFSANTLRQAAFAATGKQISDTDVAAMMKHFDADGDGAITYSELCEALLLIPEVNPLAFFETFRRERYYSDTDSLSPFGLPHDIEKEDESKILRRCAAERKGDELMKDGVVLVDHRYASHIRSMTREQLEEIELERQFRKKHNLLKKVCCGGASGALGRTLLQPVDMVRMQMQTSATPISIREAIQKSLSLNPQRSVIRNLYVGNGINCFKSVPELAIKMPLLPLREREQR